eukprot:c20810_g2_i1 orf=289-591(+)
MSNNIDGKMNHCMSSSLRQLRGTQSTAATGGDNDEAPAASIADAYQCSICLEVASLRPVVTPCGHLFCWTCLEEWTGRGKKSCPVCKGSLSQQNAIAIAF